MKSIIINDEPKGQGVLLKMIHHHCPDIQVIAMASGADEAWDLIHEHKPELVFLDLELPGDSGFALLQKFEKINFHLIVTTACDEQSLPLIPHDVFAHLLKPINAEELKSIVAELKLCTVTVNDDLQMAAEVMAGASRLSFSGKLAIPVKEGILNCAVADVIRIESDGSYSTVYVVGGKRYVISKGLKEYEELLPEKEFFRVHKSHLINIYKIKKYVRTDGHFLEMADGSLIEVARRKKDDFLQVMNTLA
jgi:two-component system LytT family response regulator